ncbi:MAG: four helix bundle protein [Syntrophobacterales bacterium]
MVRTFRELVVWQKALDLVKEIYRVTQEFPKEEIFGLTSQLRRAAVSVPSNIAEGQGRLTEKEFRQFLGNARGSLAEVETQIIIANDLDFINDQDFKNLSAMITEVGRVLNGLISSVISEKRSHKKS